MVLAVPPDKKISPYSCDARQNTAARLSGGACSRDPHLTARLDDQHAGLTLPPPAGRTKPEYRPSPSPLRYNQAKYRRLGSPVERVLEILTSLRGQMTSTRDRENMSFIVECIVSDQLYTIQLATASAKTSSGGVSKEMEGFLGRHGSAKKGERRRGNTYLITLTSPVVVNASCRTNCTRSSLPLLRQRRRPEESLKRWRASSVVTARRRRVSGSVIVLSTALEITLAYLC
jgi:hypothetical protein